MGEIRGSISAQPRADRMIFATSSAALLTSFSYPALVITASFAQPVASLVSGALVAAGSVSWLLAFVLICLTDMTVDTIWYTLGVRHTGGATNFISRTLKMKDAEVQRVTSLFHTRPAFILIGMKVLGGFGIMPLVLFTAGASGMRYVRFITLNLIGDMFWTGILMVVGFFFAASVTTIENYLSRVLFVLTCIALLAGVAYVMQRSARRLLTQ